MSWNFKSAAERFEEVRKDWDALNQARGNHLLLDSAFVSPLLRHFGGPDVLLGINQNSRGAGMALVQKTGIGLWQTFQPSQAPMGLILMKQRDENWDALYELLCDLPGYPVQFSVLQQDPDYSAFANSSGQPGIEVLDYIQTARLLLEGTFDEFWETRSRNLRHNLDRQRRRLSEQGRKLELIRYAAPSEMAACIREYGRLESQGWKAGEGTAISEESAQGRFYQEVLETFSARGEGCVYQLLVDGRVIATDLCLARNGILITLKTTYDETIERLSPALLMRQQIVHQLFLEKQIHAIEYYGRVMEWHTKWSSQIRTMYHLNCFRHRWVARVKEMVKRLS